MNHLLSLILLFDISLLTQFNVLNYHQIRALIKANKTKHHIIIFSFFLSLSLSLSRLVKSQTKNLYIISFSRSLLLIRSVFITYYLSYFENTTLSFTVVIVNPSSSSPSPSFFFFFFFILVYQIFLYVKIYKYDKYKYK